MIAVVAPRRAVDTLRLRARAGCGPGGRQRGRQPGRIFDGRGAAPVRPGRCRSGTCTPTRRCSSVGCGRLLQSLHPLAMAGVADTPATGATRGAAFTHQPTYVAVTTYGTEADADGRSPGAPRAPHGSVAPRRADRAADPHLLAWVHIAEIDSFLVAYERHGAASLSARDLRSVRGPDRRRRRRPSRCDRPATPRRLRRRLRQFHDEPRSTPEAMDAAPLPPRPATPAAGRSTRLRRPGRRHRDLAPPVGSHRPQLPTPPLADLLVGRPLGH